jgi:hypothetical protein
MKTIRFEVEEVHGATTPVRMEGYRMERVTPLVALKELFELLEDYSPMWYTEETRERAMSALKQGVH